MAPAVVEPRNQSRGFGFTITWYDLSFRWLSLCCGVILTHFIDTLVHHRPNEENQENGHLNYTHGSHVPDTNSRSYLPLPSTGHPSHHHRPSSIFEPFYTVLQRYENANGLVSGIFFFARVSFSISDKIILGFG
jgi:hypothetical protein